MESISSDEISTKESSSEEEIWDDRETDNGSEPEDMNRQVNRVLSGIYFFHLLYRLSERAITSILGLFKIIFSYLAAITNKISYF